jgi:hypothetical protein
MLQFQLGVLSQRRIGPLQLVIEYIKTGQFRAAVNILKRMDWNIQSKACFTIITLIMDHLLKPPLDSNKESLCEDSLVTFLAPSQAITDTVIVQYKERINNIARRFFHLLLRYSIQYILIIYNLLLAADIFSTGIRHFFCHVT